MSSKPHIAVDFDGVIHRYSKGWDNGSICDIPVTGAIQTLAKLSEKYDVIIFTTRLNPDLRGEKLQDHEKEVVDWLAKHNFKKGVHYSEFMGSKPVAKIYLDGSGLRFKNWRKALADIDSLT